MNYVTIYKSSFLFLQIMNALSGLVGDYGSGSDSSDNETSVKEVPEDVQNLVKHKCLQVVSAPDVITKEEVFQSPFMVDTSKPLELTYNPTYEELFAPEQGPKNPFKTNQALAKANTLTGYVEKAHINDFQFDNQRKTFHSYGYAEDPSLDSGGVVITNCHKVGRATE